jgi:hypothetical protein
VLRLVQRFPQGIENELLVHACTRLSLRYVLAVG